MLGLLCRLHHLQIQAELQRERYPKVERHKCKHGIQNYKEYSLKEISNHDIIQAIERGHKQAMGMAELLGMSELLKQQKSQQETVFMYIPLSSYLCTLQEGGLVIIAYIASHAQQYINQ